MPGQVFLNVQDDINLRILRMLEGTCALDAPHISVITMLTNHSVHEHFIIIKFKNVFYY